MIKQPVTNSTSKAKPAQRTQA
jgi:hypothetical protein